MYCTALKSNAYGVGAFASHLLTVACLLAGNSAVSGILDVAGFPAVTGIFFMKSTEDNKGILPRIERSTKCKTVLF